MFDNKTSTDRLYITSLQ